MYWYFPFFICLQHLNISRWHKEYNNLLTWSNANRSCWSCLRASVSCGSPFFSFNRRKTASILSQELHKLSAMGKHYLIQKKAKSCISLLIRLMLYTRLAMYIHSKVVITQLAVHVTISHNSICIIYGDMSPLCISE